MAKRIRREIVINGVKCWVCGATEQEYAEKLLKMFNSSSEVKLQDRNKHNFEKYAWNWYNIFSKPNVSYVTGLTYYRQLQTHILPMLKEKCVEDISSADIQMIFNSMGNDVTKATKNKVRSVLSMVFNQALDEGIIEKSPLDSRSLRIKGKESTATKPYSVENMQYLVSHIDILENEQDRAYIALAALHPLRPEEVLGLQWQDIDFVMQCIYVRRAVTHPSRNLGMVGDTKTTASKRRIALVPQVKKYLQPGKPHDFLLGGEHPLSYTQVRRMCDRIQKQINFPERIQPRRFRTTVLTDIYDMTKDIKSAQAAAGHTTAAMTLKYYVKGRQNSQDTATPIAAAYGLKTDN